MRLPFSNMIDLNQHYVEIANNKLGIKRKVWVENFSFSPTNKRFSLVVRIKHYYNEKIVVPAEYDEYDNLISEETIIDGSGYGEYINDMDSINDIVDEFIGDEQIMVYFNPSNPSDDRNGEILNPNREPVTENVPHISQYESIYHAFTTDTNCVQMIKKLLNNYTNWKE